MMARDCVVFVMLSILLVSCASKNNSQFISDNQYDQDTFLKDQPGNNIIVIYNHGSTSEYKKDPCHPERSQNVWGTPLVIRDLSGKSLDGTMIQIFTLCSEIPNGDYNSLTRKGELKVLKRADEITHKIESFIQMGVPPKQIFLAGHSAGGWASLMVLKKNPDMVNSAIVFAPAFAGKFKSRSSGWEWVYSEQKKELIDSFHLPALVYVFQKDPYNRLEDLIFLETINGVTMIHYQADYPHGSSCDNVMFSGHRTTFNRCFSEGETDTILNFIRSRLAMTE